MNASNIFAALSLGSTARRALVALFLSLAATAALAQSQSWPSQDDPPSRVGRLSELQGPVFIAPDDPNADWQPIGLNYPVTVGDNVWSGQDGRAEIDFGAGHVRLGRETNIHFQQLDDRQFSAYLAGGRAILSLRMLDPGETAKFDTANVQVDILRPGSYRIEADADGLGSTIVVRDGEVELRTVDRSTIVYSGQTATISGNGPGSAIVVRDGVGTDGFDQWSADRDRRLDSPGVSTQYVSGYVPGVSDLDHYGNWETVPTYGAVWYPTAVASDWVPYRDGSWTFVRPWGWTWVDSAPWGWTPFHYGRWVRIGPRWAWCPGEFVRRPVYAPALVAWYGGPSGTSWSVNFSGGGPTFGWVPLAWGEPYYPHHRYSTTYWRTINRPYAVNVNRVSPKPLQATYANARYPGAVTAVRGEVFTGKQPIGRNHIAVPVAALTGAAVTTTALAVRPITRPISVDARPRGAPAPASTFIGRGGPVERPELRTPGTGGVYTGRPGTITEPAVRQPYTPSVGGGRAGIVEPIPGGRPTYAPQAGGRQMNVEPATGATPMRPGAGSPPSYLRQPDMQTVRPITREPAQATTVTPSAPQQNPGQVYVPQQRQAPLVTPSPSLQGSGQVYAPAPQRQTTPARAPQPEQGQIQQRPFAREEAPRAAPQYLPTPQYAPAPQQIQPAPQAQRFVAPQPHVAPAQVQQIQVAPPPAPAPAPAPAGRGQPTPAQPNQVTPPGMTPAPVPR